MLQASFTMVRDFDGDRERPASTPSVTVLIAAWRVAATIGRAGAAGSRRSDGG
jgi:hypothetical protein